VRDSSWSLGRAALVAGTLLVAATGLGLVPPSPAEASCAGPQLAFEQHGIAVAPRRVGSGDDEKVLFDLRRDQAVRVTGSNLTYECRDTYSSTQRGCGAPEPEPVTPITPLEDVELVLTQGSRSWSLGRFEPIGSDLTAEVEVSIPTGARPGAARLALVESGADGTPAADLNLS